MPKMKNSTDISNEKFKVRTAPKTTKKNIGTIGKKRGRRSIQMAPPIK